MEKIAAAVLAALLLAPAAAGQELDGRQIAEKVDKANRPRTEIGRFTMHIVSPAGEKRTRTLTTWFKSGQGDDDRTLVRFETPADVKGTGLLTIEKGDDDEQWLYLPELRKSKKIAGASKSLSFMGTDFSNYDMRTEDLSGHDYKRQGDEDLGGRGCYIVEALPKDADVKDETGYSRRKLWVDRERFTTPKVEYYDKNGKLLKVAETEEWETVEGLWRPKRITMRNVQEGSKTIVLYDRGREINKDLDDGVFTRRSLEKP